MSTTITATKKNTTFKVTPGNNIIKVTLASTTSVGLNQETPTGSVDGSNKVFTLSNEPLASWVIFTVNGQTQIDYSVSGSNVTLSWAPPSGSDIYAHYLT